MPKISASLLYSHLIVINSNSQLFCQKSPWLSFSYRYFVDTIFISISKIIILYILEYKWLKIYIFKNWFIYSIIKVGSIFQFLKDRRIALKLFIN